MANNLTNLKFPPLPAHLRARMEERKDQPLAYLIPGGAQPARISIEGNRFTLINADGEEIPLKTLEMYMVVVGENKTMSRMYYEKMYTPGQVEFTPPDCWSDNGIGASNQCNNPQSLSCKACEWSIWGSATSSVSGKKKPACQEFKKLAVLVAGGLYRLDVKPGSFGNWQSYCKAIAKGGADVLQADDVVTLVEFESTGVLKFSPADYVNAEHVAMQTSYKKGGPNHKDLVEMLGLDDKAVDKLTTKQPEPQAATPTQRRKPQPRTEQPQPAANTQPQQGFAQARQSFAQPQDGHMNGRGFAAPETNAFQAQETDYDAPQEPENDNDARNPEAPPTGMGAGIDGAFDLPLSGWKK